LAQLAAGGRPGRFRLPRPMLTSGDLNMSFSGLKTAVLTEFRAAGFYERDKADLAAEFEQAIADVLVHKSLAAARAAGIGELVVAGGVGANLRLRTQLNACAAREGLNVFYPPLEFCTDNGAMVAFAGALRMSLQGGCGSRDGPPAFSVKPRWDLEMLAGR
jgi:N6-L-threonylcarbamoyladenine synthase